MGRCVFPTQWGSTAACGGDGAADGGAERNPRRPRSESVLLSKAPPHSWGGGGEADGGAERNPRRPRSESVLLSKAPPHSWGGVSSPLRGEGQSRTKGLSPPVAGRLRLSSLRAPVRPFLPSPPRTG